MFKLAVFNPIRYSFNKKTWVSDMVTSVLSSVRPRHKSGPTAQLYKSSQDQPIRVPIFLKVDVTHHPLNGVAAELVLLLNWYCAKLVLLLKLMLRLNWCCC